MWLNDLSLRIPEGREVPGGYVEMKHNTQYTLVLHNHRNVRCDAKVEIDGKHQGDFRINANSTINLERPAHDTGRFTFYKLGSNEANQSKLNKVSRGKLGLVQVTFVPENVSTDCPDISTCDTTGTTRTVYKSYNFNFCHNVESTGGTGLSDNSSQFFKTVYQLHYDYSQRTIIHLRLVAVEESSCNYGPRPLSQYSSPIPPSM